MGQSIKLDTLFFLEELPASPDEVVERTITLLGSHGVGTRDRDGEVLLDREELDGEEISVDREGVVGEAIDRILSGSGRGSLRTDIEDGVNPGRVSFNLNDEGWSTPNVGLSGPDKFALREREVSLETARRRVETVAAIVEDLAVALDPWLVVSRCFSDHQVEWPTYPEGRPPDSGIEELAWVNVFGEEWFEHFGGKERILDAPAYEVAELENGSIFVRTEEIPGHFHPDAEGPGEHSAYEYLFEGKSRADLEAELADRKSTYVDPFRELEVGELGSDVVVCQDHADFDLPDMDYEHVPPEDEADPCGVVYCRRDGDGLWDAQSGTFVRRLVDEDGAPIGDLPKDVAPHEEFVSTVVGTEYSDPVGADMIEMEDLDDESLLVMVYDVVGMLVDPEEHEED